MDAHAESTRSESIPAGPNEFTYFYLWDQVGSVRVVANGQGVTVETHDYEPYGLEMSSATCPSSSLMRYAGQERDYLTSDCSDTVDYMHYRFYASTMGRFMRPDNVSGSLLNPQDWNLYSYVRGNPVSFNDPTGHAAGSPYPDHPPLHMANLYTGGMDLEEYLWGSAGASMSVRADVAAADAAWQSWIANAQLDACTAALGNVMGEATRDTNGSNVVYDASGGQMYVVSGGRVLDVAPMSHNNITAGSLYLGNGAYPFMDTTSPHHHGSMLDSENGAYGPFGIFRLDFSYTRERSHWGMGIHSGRVDRGGPCSRTNGCFRTTDEGMAAIMAAANWLPLNSFYVVNEPYDTHVVQTSGGY